MKQKLNCVLLIDDDRTTNFLNERVIKQVDCVDRIEVEQTGMKALKFLNAKESAQPDLILLDINMPGMNGWEFLDEFREPQKEKQKNIVIIMITTSQNPEDAERTKTVSKISGFKKKPLTSEMLNEILREHFSDRV